MSDAIELSSQARVLAFAGIHNFRDYGGYAVPGGRLLAGRLYRSAQHRDATDDDLARVGRIGFSAIVDLRTDGERRAAPCPRPPGFAARVIFADAETAGLAPHVEAARSIASPMEARASMCRGYAEMPFRPYLVAMLRHYFAALAGENGATLIHCMAGKDRTGLAVALFHALMGVHPDDRMDDYMLTNEAGDIEARIESGGRYVRSIFGAQLSDEAVRVLMRVDPAYLDAAFAAIAERHGSVRAYLEHHLGVTPEMRAQIAARFTTTPQLPE
jgi:protein tyrosine/serine phosphatase